jgi:uncharacterized protein YukE
MNIFMTSFDPHRAALDHCVVHRNKMIIEVSQMLSTAHRVLDGDEEADDLGLYKSTHINHPCSVWARSSVYAYQWTYQHLEALHEYYEADTNRLHASRRILQPLALSPGNTRYNHSGPSDRPVMAMPPEFQSIAIDDGVPGAYQAYLNYKFLDWSNRVKPVKLVWPFGKPTWLSENLRDYADKCGSK